MVVNLNMFQEPIKIRNYNILAFLVFVVIYWGLSWNYLSPLSDIIRFSLVMVFYLPLFIIPDRINYIERYYDFIYFLNMILISNVVYQIGDINLLVWELPNYLYYLISVIWIPFFIFYLVLNLFILFYCVNNILTKLKYLSICLIYLLLIISLIIINNFLIFYY